MKALQIRDLHKNYGDTEVLKGVTLSVDQGEMYALMGPNGSGKTTLTSIIACTNTLTSGTIEVFGYDTVKDTKKVKKLIGYVPQEKFSTPLMTGEENLLYFIRLLGVPKQEARKMTKELLQKMDLTKDANKRVSQYSGGMRKKLEVATALLPGVKILILDEPTTGLDPSTRKKFLSKIQEIRKEGVTVFFVTHIGEDAEIASKIGLIDKGTLVIEEKPSVLRRKTGLFHVISIETSTKNEQVYRTLEDTTNNGKLLETNSGYKFYCKEPDEMIESMIRNLGKIGCKTTRIETTIPSLEDVFFKLTEKELR
ncbi:MAG: ABC transporter ATP-binding protein [Candidatus Thorarchaeota archaeon]